ncbi:hypothetical protein NEOKW01_1291 [Nematocida sp. AWRm80]|nr:hypothetical protein NEOKW01_1291 [Nematocida sp. AWRm80]
MVWCIFTRKTIPHEDEIVSKFLKRNNYSLLNHIIIKITYHNEAYASEETLFLSSRLDKSISRREKYILTKSELKLNVYLNIFTRTFLETASRRIRLYLPETATVSMALDMLQEYFPGFKEFQLFSLYLVTCGKWEVSVAEIKKMALIKSVSLHLQLQPNDPFGLSKIKEPSFTEEFKHLKSFTSTQIFSDTYNICLYGHYLHAVKKGSTATFGNTIELTYTTKAYKQIVGNKTFAVVDKDGTRWALYSKTESKIESLLDSIYLAPRYNPYEIETDADNLWRDYCNNIEDILSQKISQISLPNISSLLPHTLDPQCSDSLESTVPELFHKLRMQLQRSIWDNVNIEFILYLLQKQNIPKITDILKEVKEFSEHRKQILSQVNLLKESSLLEPSAPIPILNSVPLQAPVNVAKDQITITQINPSDHPQKN